MSPGSEPLPPARADDWSALKDIVRRFEQAWRETPQPNIDEYLPDGDSLRSGALIELVHIDLELCLKAGVATRVEEYLARYPVLADDRAVAVELITAEYELRQRRQPNLVFDDYVQRFPQYRAELTAHIAAPTVTAGDAPQRPSDTRIETPPEVQGYEILRRLGRGGMGVVFAARQLSLNRLVALKFLPEDSNEDPLWLERFRREALTASALNHPHICTIYDMGESSGRPYLSMELIEGRTLADLTGQPPTVDELVRLIGHGVRALIAAHAAGVVHRDIKPQNLMVRNDGILKVLDFGLARRLPGVGSADAPQHADVGTRFGTLRYMSPEQSRGESAGTASDIFSLGVVMYEMTAGQHPFSVRGKAGAMHSVSDNSPLPIRRLNPDVPAALETVVQHMLATDPRLRPTAAEVDAALTELTRTETNRFRHPSHASRHSVTVGRERELAALRSGFDAATAGSGLVLCVTGEPGIGKTTVFEDFLAELAANDRHYAVARGQCSERLAGTEAYLPFLEAMDSLIQGPIGAAAAQVMKVVAPTWYVQLAPSGAVDPALVAVMADAKGASQERRKRELGVFLHEISRTRPLVMFLDDVHWADPSSVDLLAYLGTKCSGTRLLLVLTYRPSDLLRSQHPFGPVKLELQGRGVCREIALPYLSRNDFDRYLALAYDGHEFPEEFVAVLYARTEGNPLFMVDLLRYLRDRGVIINDHEHWALAGAIPDLQRELPESVRSMIQRKMDQLTAPDRHLLMAASVQGPEFDSAVVAQLLGRAADEVEERLDALERVHRMVRLVREHSFPDRTLTLRYSFVHVLYQNALYAALLPTRKMDWSAAAAGALLGHYGDKSAGLAAELAMLFEAAHDPERAAEYYRVAAENAARLFAHHEAMALARRGVALLQTLPETPERDRRELPLQMILGIQLQVVQGYAAPEAERTYDRARMLCERGQDTPSLFLVLWGRWMVYEVRSALKKSLELANHLFTLAEGTKDRAQLLQARLALAVTSFSLGDLAATREHSEQGVALYDPQRHINHCDLYGQDPKVACLAFGAVSLWQLGYPDQARERSLEAVSLGQELGHPTTRALALYFATMLRQYCREAPVVLETAEATTAIATEHGLSLWLANGLVMGGWAQAEQGACTKGIAMLRQGLTDWAATGAETHRTYFLGLLAEALGRESQYEEGLSVLSEALTLMHRTGTVFHGPELHRLQGEFLLRREASETAGRDAESCFHRALDMARCRQAKSLELRAAMSLTRLYQEQGRRAKALPILAECYDWFTEGFDTADLQDAKTLLG